MTFFNEELNLKKVNLHYDLIDLYCPNDDFPIYSDFCTIKYDNASSIHEILNKNSIFHRKMVTIYDISQDNIKLETLKFLQETASIINNAIERLKEEYDQYIKAHNELLSKKEILTKDDLYSLKSETSLKKEYCTIYITKYVPGYDVYINFLNKINYENSFLFFYNIRRTVNKDFNNKVNPFMIKVFNEMKEDILILENEVERINKFIGNYSIFL